MSQIQTTSPRELASDPDKPRGGPPIRFRAVLLGLMLVPLLCWWSMRTEIINGGSEMIEASLLVIVVFTLFLLVLINGVVRRLTPALALTTEELLVVYVMQTTSVGVAGLGQIQFLNQVLGAAFHYATPQNHWADFHRFIPWWWVPDQSVLADYYNGHSSFFTPQHVRGWAFPILTWSVFIALMLVCFLCINTMLRRHWIEHERLTFPLVALPLALTRTDTGQSLLRHAQFWIAFAIVCGYRSISGMHRILPSFPDIPGAGFKGQLIDLTGMVTGPPWDSIGFLKMSFHPMIVGISYFAPLDVSFSMWFFYLVVKVEDVLAAAWGFRDAGAGQSSSLVPYTGEQGAGAFLGLAMLSLWGARRHLRDVWLKAFGRAPNVSDSNEPLSYRTAVFGFLASFAALVLFVVLGGLAWQLAVCFFALYLLMITAVTRLRAEAGPMLNYGPDMNPHQMMATIPGSDAWNAQNLTPMAYLQWFDSDYRTVAMPQQMEALKIANTVNIPVRRLSAWILCASVAATLAAFVSVLAIYYQYGAVTGRGDNDWRIDNGQYPFEMLRNWMTDREGPSIVQLQWIGVGFAVVFLLVRARTLFLWWPFHPAGFCLAHAGWAMPWVWFPTLIGWTAKSLILRYGGIGVFRTYAPFFMGLIVGDIVIACLWSILGMILNTNMYMFFPG